MLPTPFEQGILYAVALLVKLHDQPTMAANIVREAGLGNINISSMDDFERESLKKLKGEHGISFIGF